MSLRDRIEGLDPRERRLLNLMFIVFIVFVAIVGPLGLTAMARARTAENEELRSAVEAIQDARTAVNKASAQRDAIVARYKKKAPPLAGLLDQLARQSGIEIPESQDRAVVPHGKQFEERSTKVLLRRVGMLSLAKFLERIEKSNYPIVLSRLSIRKRSTEDDSFDVELIVSAFDRKETAKKSDKKPEAAEEPEE